MADKNDRRSDWRVEKEGNNDNSGKSERPKRNRISTGDKRSEGERSDRRERPSSDRRERSSGERSSSDRRERPNSDRRDRPSSERPSSDRRERPSSDRRDRSSSERSSSDRRDRPSSDRRDRPSSERSSSDRRDRPSFDREKSSSERSNSDRRDRPSSDRRDRPSSERSSSDRRDRPSFDRRDRSSSERSDRREGSSSDRRDRPSFDRREGSSSDRRDRPSSDRRERSSSERSDRREGSSSDRRDRPSFDRKERSSREGSSSDRRDRPSREGSSSDRREGSSGERGRPFKPFRIKGKSFNSKKVESDGKVRLNKFIANSGACSRREADEFITMGLVSVNGQHITELGTRVEPTDDVRLNGKVLRGEKSVYVLLNKPKGFVTSVRDPFHDKTVMDLVKKACKERIFPVGRLDKDTTGVLLFTNDGELAGKLIHPSYNKKKIYHVFLDRNMETADLDAMAEGLKLRDGFIKADSVNYAGDKKNEIGLEIHSGKNRIVRRMFAHLGYKVSKLDRVYFAGLTKKNLQRGDWRILTEKEVEVLKMGSYE